MTRPENWISPATHPFDENQKELHTRRPTWWMRRNLHVESLGDEVTLDITCLGYYELYINGDKVGDEPLAPSVTRLDRRAFTISHEISSQLLQGDNCIALWCSSGWYLPNQFSIHENWTPLLKVEMKNSSNAISDLSDDSWQCCASNVDIIGEWDWNKFGGEEVDARQWNPTWNRRECDTTHWHPSRLVSPPDIVVEPRTCRPNRIGEAYRAQSVRQLEPGRFEVDFGTCLAGWVDIQFSALRPGQEILMRFFDLPADKVNIKDRRGNPKDHSYAQRSIYIGAGNESDRFINRFNYAGFRYMTIEGLDEAPPLEAMKALLVESALDRKGWFSCSHDLYNRIHHLNLHTLRCLNLGGYSVDCPSRERMGYGADGQTSIPAYVFLLDSEAFLSKWLTDWLDVYDPDSSHIPMTAPIPHSSMSSPPWSGIVGTIAWDIYLYYGNRTPMEESFPVLQGHLRKLQSAVKGGVLREELGVDMFIGDWVPAGRGMETKRSPDIPMIEMFCSCYLIYLWQTYIKICGALNRTECIDEAESAISLLKEGIHREYYLEEQGIYLMPEQSFQAMPLLAGVVPNELRNTVLENLIDLIKEQGWHMDTGLPGTTLMLKLLEEAGEHEVIARIYHQEDYPSWGYMLAKGATAIWEQWNGFWSQIHSCFAGPASWFYTGLAGIRPHESGPGFRIFELAPAIVEGVDHVEAKYDSKQGRIESHWKRENHRVQWKIRIPEGSKALVRVPSDQPENVTLDGEPLSHGASTDTNAKGRPEVCFELGGGCYVLEWPKD